MHRRHQKMERKPVLSSCSRRLDRSLVIEYTSRAKNTNVSETFHLIFDITYPYLAAIPLSQLNPKKKIFETIQPGLYSISFALKGVADYKLLPSGFTTLETKEAVWIDPATKSIHRIRTTNGFCLAPTFIGASLS